MYWFSAVPFGDFLAGDYLTTIAAGVVGASTSLFRERTLRKEFDASDKYLSLLYRLVPRAIAERIQKGEFPIADTHAEVTILFADLVGFSELAGKLPSLEVVKMLNNLFELFDDAAARHKVEKLKTIGDGYMAMCGPPVDETQRVGNIVGLAEEMLAIVNDFPVMANTKLQLRIGINTGTVVAGVIGRDRFTYDVWGETVNTASRMESTGLPGRIQVSRNAHRWLREDFEFEPHAVHAHGMGDLETFLLLRNRGKLN
jgi:class 3 adenylate cyclase